ncbi:MAG TPA: hypothetical protein VHC67_12840 [Gaiellaceae bacterium]|jgi:hypothetical protein|nr:hypothetical protein [Gaiellaceae bacterium]
MDTRLERLGDRLEEAARRNVAPRRFLRKRLAVAVAALAVLVPAASVAAAHFISNDQVAASLPQGTLSLAGTDPTCTTKVDGVEYRCTLAKAPAPEVSDWLGTVEPTVDASKHVNGGCRSLNHEGTEWECYIGQKAVDEQIIGRSFLGEYAPSPGVG